MSDLIIYSTIENWDQSISLSSLYSEKTDKHDMPSIILKKGGKEIFNADNPDYIVYDFYNFLTRFIDRRLKPKDKQDFADIWELCTDEWVQECLDIIRTAARLEMIPALIKAIHD